MKKMTEAEIHAEACKLYELAFADYEQVPAGERDVSTVLRALELVHLTCPREPVSMPPEVTQLLRKPGGGDEPWREGGGPTT